MDSLVRVCEWLYLATMIIVVILGLFIIVVTPVWLLTNFTVETLTGVGVFFLIVGLMFFGQRLDWRRFVRQIVGTKHPETNLSGKEA